MAPPPKIRRKPSPRVLALANRQSPRFIDPQLVLAPKDQGKKEGDMVSQTRRDARQGLICGEKTDNCRSATFDLACS